MPNNLSWTTPASSEPIVGYIVYRKIGPGALSKTQDFLAMVTAPTTQFVDNNLTKTTLENPGYNYAVTALSGAGESDFSNTLLITFGFEELVYTEGWNSTGVDTITTEYTEGWDFTITSTPSQQYEEEWENTVAPGTPSEEYKEEWEEFIIEHSEPWEIPTASYSFEHNEFWELPADVVYTLEHSEDWDLHTWFLSEYLSIGSPGG